MKYRTINVDLNREYRNDLNWNFEQIAKDIEQSDNVSEEDKKELLEEIARVERESKERDDLLAGESLEDFLTKIRNAIDGADEATENANQSADNADDKALYATEQGDYAKEQGDYAKEQAEFANTKAEYADEKAIYANEMAGKASDEASNLSGLKNDVAEATTKANQSATNANEKAEYAQTQGKRAEDASDLVQELIDEGPVQSVNGKTGTVELSSSDVGAETPEGAQEKANTAESNANEYTDEQIGNVEIPVTSVNEKTGAVTINKTDVGLSNVTNIKQASDASFINHKDDESAHGIGDKSTLETTEKSTIVGAINEVFTTGNNVKRDTVDALLSVDDSLPVTSDSNWSDVIGAIGGISTGKKWASGVVDLDANVLEITDLPFEPSVVYAQTEDGKELLISTKDEGVYNIGGSARVISVIYDFSKEKIKLHLPFNKNPKNVTWTALQ